MCEKHAPCNCSGVNGEHLRTHVGCVHHDAVAERANLWPALTFKIRPGNTDLGGEHSLAWFFGLPESGTVDVGDSSLPLHVRRQPSRPPILSRSLSPSVLISVE